MTKHFTFSELFSFGLAKTRQHAWFIVLTFIIIGILINAVRLSPFMHLIVTTLIGLSVASVSLLMSRDHHFTFADLYNPLLSPKRVLKYVALTFIYCVSVAIGLILLIIPGIYVAIRFKFFTYLVLEHENASIEELIKMTYRLTKNNFWSIFGFIVLAIIFNLLGLLCLVIGLFVTVPITVLASAHMYNKLKEHATLS
jgi:hypothetical protein